MLLITYRPNFSSLHANANEKSIMQTIQRRMKGFCTKYEIVLLVVFTRRLREKIVSSRLFDLVKVPTNHSSASQPES